MYISTNSAQLFTVSFGSQTNPAILAIGGWIGSWELWADPLSILSHDWFTVAYDHRGAGATIAPLETITFERLVEDVFTILDAYEVETCVLAAESAGAITALGAALSQPDRVKGLAIVDGMYFREKLAEDPFLSGLHDAYGATIDSFIEACVPERNSDHIKRWGKQIVSRSTQEAAIALYLSQTEIDLRGRMQDINQPTLIVHGEADQIVPVTDAQWLSQALPNAKLVVLKGAGHVPTMTQPEEVARLMKSYFRLVK